MIPIYRDWETRSPTPIRYGVDNYFRPCRPLLFTYAIADGPVELIDFTQPNHRKLPAQMQDPGYVIIGHNNQFDRRCEERLAKLFVPLERYRCTQAQAYAHGLPGSLETLADVLKTKHRKRVGDMGHKLMLFFCTPRSILKDGTPVYNEPGDFPQKWEDFKAYAIDDTETLRDVYKKLPTYNYVGANLDTWFLDQRINERGFGFDSGLAVAARAVLDAASAQQKRYTRALTNDEVKSVTQRQKLLDWFNASGLEIAKLTAAEIRDALESDDLPAAHRFLLELRIEGSKSSGAKYRRGLECVGPDGRLRDTMNYCGANRTGRWAGRTFQPQNLPRPTARWEDLDKADPWKPIEQVGLPLVLSGDVAAMQEHGGATSLCNDVIRSAIIPELGNKFISADWANIESRFLAWCTENQWKLDYFFMVDRGEAPDSYKALWARFFGMPIEDVTKAMRQAAKVTDLALGFLGGTGALISMAVSNGVDMDGWPDLILPRATEAQIKKARSSWRRAFLEGEDYGVEPKVYQAADILKQLYRAANKAVVDAGYHIGKVVADAMAAPNTLFRTCKCDLWYNGHALIIQLPCGRRLFYWSPQMRPEKEIDPETGDYKIRQVFWYKASRGKQWRWLKGWPGLWIENIVQAGANSILRAGMRNVQDYCMREPKIRAYLETLPANARTPIVLHVHDEPTCELPTGMLPHEVLEWLLTDDLASKHAWMRGLPLAASGWTGTRYRK